MRIVAITAQTIRWTIASRGAARGHTERAAVLLEVRSDSGAIGLGEAAPLPGLSIDTIDDAARAIAAFASLVPFEVIHRDSATATPLEPRGEAPREHRDPAHVGARDVLRAAARAPHSQVPHRDPAHVGARDVPHVRAPWTDFVATPEANRLLPFKVVDRNAAHMLATAPPAARFAIETALGDAIARDRGVSLAALLAAPGEPAPVDARTGGPASGRTTPPHPQVGDGKTAPLAAVVDDPEDARRAYAAGIRCFKIKLGADDSLDRVFAIAAAAPGARLRIDANRSWSRAGVADRIAALAGLPIEYVEEPCRDAHQLLHAAALACPLALDESLAALSRDDLLAALRSPQLAAVILKPTLLGGLSAALELAALARRFGVTAVASHALEGPIGTAACAELARALAGERPLTTSGVTDITDGAAHLAGRRAASQSAGLAAHAALAGWRIHVEQLAADHLAAADAPGLGFADLDLTTAVQACNDRIFDEAPLP